METPVEDRKWLGDPDEGVCPNCHSSLVYPGDKHWDGVEFPYECAVCGCGGTMGTNPNTGRPWLVIDPENGHIRDRFIDKSRAEHLNEIVQTRINFFQKQGEIKDTLAEYKAMKFPTVEIKR